MIRNIVEEDECSSQPRRSSWNRDETGPKLEVEEHRIDIDIVKVSLRVQDWINGSVGKANERSTPPWPSIPKVPDQILRETAPRDFMKFYEPRVISVGPYHHGKPHLHSGERIKPLCAQEFMAASHQRIQDVYKKIESNIGAVRKCYDSRPTNKYDDETLAWMMLMDGCFILQFILSDGEGETKILLRQHQISFVEDDLFLLENQLPFRVLELIFEEANLSMKDKIKQYVIAAIGWPAEGSSIQLEDDQPAHLLHLLRSALLGSRRRDKQPEQEEKKAAAAAADEPYNNNNNNIHGCRCWRRMKEFFLSFKCLFLHMIRLLSARLISSKIETDSSCEGGGNDNWQSFRHIRELKAAGIHFQPSGTSFLSDISFESHFFYGYLKLPFLLIDDSTKPRFLNLVAYEMCPDAPDDYAVTSFLAFLDSLIDHPDDVKELRSKKILYNCLGSDEEVARIFNEITDGLVDLGTYEDVKDHIQKHYDKRVNTWIAQALHDHFSSPWTIMAFIAAVFIILLTAVQTYFAIPGK